MHLDSRSPAKPEEADGNQDTTQEGGWQAKFRLRAVGSIACFLVLLDQLQIVPVPSAQQMSAKSSFFLQSPAPRLVSSVLRHWALPGMLCASFLSCAALVACHAAEHRDSRMAARGKGGSIWLLGCTTGTSNSQGVAEDGQDHADEQTKEAHAHLVQLELVVIREHEGERAEEQVERAQQHCRVEAQAEAHGLQC